MTYAMLLSSHRLIKVLEWITLIALVWAFAAPQAGNGFFARLGRWTGVLARSRKRAMITAALFPMLVRAVMLPWYPPPKPQIHDEFSYLLQADTFAHGRVVNPAPPYPEHFESEYVLLQPTYASQYQPAQGLALAFGELALGSAWAGVWLSMGLMFAALCWALSYIFPLRWALRGSIGAALQFGIFGIWMNSYFGGAIAAAAGALVLGSLFRMNDHRQAASAAALCATGIIVLFGSRPFEGLLWLGVSVVWIALQFRKRGSRNGLALRMVPVSVSFALVFVAGSAALAWYNWRVTGNPFDPPYLTYRRIYGTPQPFWWQAPIHVDRFRFAELRDNYLNQLHLYEARTSPADIFSAETSRLKNFWRFFTGPLFTPCLVFLWVALRDKRLRPLLYISIPFMLDKATYHAWFPAQNAPETILIVAIFLQCWRHLLVAGRRQMVGRAIGRNLVAACFLVIVAAGAGRATEPYLPALLRHLPPIWESLYPARRLRDDVAEKLAQIPGRHLVFVDFGPEHCFCEEWIANSADIRNQPIVFARDVSLESDIRLASWLSDHDVWVVEPDARPYTLERLNDAVLDRLERNLPVTSPEQVALSAE